MRELNEQVLLVGAPGTGKTRLWMYLTTAKWLPNEEWVFVHDPNGQVRKLGASARLYRDTHAWRAAAAAAAAAKQPLPRVAGLQCETDELTNLIIELGGRHNRDEDVRFPMRVIYDEGSMMESTGASYAAKLDVRLCSRRRHLGAAPVYLVQEPLMVPKPLWVYATDVYLFEGLEGRELEHVIARAHLSRCAAELDVLNTEPGHGVLHCKPYRGIVGEL